MAHRLLAGLFTLLGLHSAQADTLAILAAVRLKLSQL